MSQFDHLYRADQIWTPGGGIYKLSEFAPVDASGNPNVHRIVFTRGSIIKCAAPFPNEVRQVIASLEDDPKGVWTVCNALGSHEMYGMNKNGDAFPYLGLTNLGEEYGHKTFEKFAYPYEHHVNKDPAKSCGERVKYAFWDDPMHKVLLIYKVSREKAPHIAERLDRDEPVPTSMGCKVPFDVCLKCGHKASKTADYCDCLKYYMGKIDPDGKAIGAANIFPRFFDISHVLRGADKISYAMGKAKKPDRGGADLDDIAPVPEEPRTKKAFYMNSAQRCEEAGLVDIYKQAEDMTAIMAVRNSLPDDSARGVEQRLMKTAASFTKTAEVVDGLPMGNPGAPRKTDAEIDAHLIESIEKESGIHPEDLARWRSRFRKSSGDKAATITKQIPGMMEKAHPEEAALAPALATTEAQELDLPAQLINMLGREVKLAAVLDTAGAYGILFKPHEFQRLVLASCKEEALADSLERAGLDFTMLPKHAAFDELPPEGQAPPAEAGELDYWDAGPNLLQHLLQWLSPDDAGQPNAPAEKALNVGNKIDDGGSWLTPKISRLLIDDTVAQLMRKVAWQRSGYARALYGRMVGTLREMSKEALDPAQLSMLNPSALMPQGPNKVLVIQGGGDQPREQAKPMLDLETVKALLAGQPHREEQQTGSWIPTLLGLRLLYEMYRGKMDHAHEQGLAKHMSLREPLLKKLGFRMPNTISQEIAILDTPDTRSMSEIFADEIREKRAGFPKAVRASTGVPTSAFFKFAYRRNHVGRDQPGIRKKAELECSNFFLDRFLGEPIGSHEKCSELLSIAEDNLIDAAIVAGLTFAGRVL